MMTSLRSGYKRSVIMAAAGMLLLGAASCKKFTELSPKDKLDDKAVFVDSAHVELAMNGVYQTAAIGSYNDDYTLGRGYPFGAAAIEQAEMRGEDMVNLGGFYAFTYNSTYSSTSANNVNMWVNLYAMINQANVFIEGVREAAAKGVVSAGKGKQLESEARFLRALAHHEALIQFCRPYAANNGGEMGVPYRDVAINSVDKIQEAMKVPRGTVKEGYTKLLADLDFAEQNMSNDAPVDNASRATKGAVIALKMRVKQHMGDWAGVIAEGAKLGTSGGSFTSPILGYKLTASPETPFTSANKNNGESIFSIANSALSNGDTNGALASMWGPADKGGRGLVATSPNLFNAAFWVSDDIRRTLLQVKQTTKDDNNNPSQNYYFNYKFRDYVNKSDWAPIIRYAEVLLNAAEAYARTGNNGQAFLLFNAVRNRSLPATSPNRLTVAPADMVQAVLNERRIEFAGEGRRWPDIHRLALDPKYSTKGIPAKVSPGVLKNDGTDYDIVKRPVVTPTVKAIDYLDHRFVWPLPATEISSNPTLKQNPNY